MFLIRHGRSFHNLGAATWKERSPSVASDLHELWLRRNSWIRFETCENKPEIIENTKKGYFQEVPVKEWTSVKVLHKLNVNKPLPFTETNYTLLKKASRRGNIKQLFYTESHDKRNYTLIINFNQQ